MQYFQAAEYIGIDPCEQALASARQTLENLSLNSKASKITLIRAKGEQVYGRDVAQIIQPSPPIHYGTLVIARHPNIQKDIASWKAMIKAIASTPVQILVTTYQVFEHNGMERLLTHQGCHKVHEQFNTNLSELEQNELGPIAPDLCMYIAQLPRSDNT